MTLGKMMSLNPKFLIINWSNWNAVLSSWPNLSILPLPLLQLLLDTTSPMNNLFMWVQEPPMFNDCSVYVPCWTILPLQRDHVLLYLNCLQHLINSFSRTILVFSKKPIKYNENKERLLKQSLLVDTRLLIQKEYFIHYYLEGFSLSEYSLSESGPHSIACGFHGN